MGWFAGSLGDVPAVDGPKAPVVATGAGSPYDATYDTASGAPMFSRDIASTFLVVLVAVTTAGCDSDTRPGWLGRPKPVRVTHEEAMRPLAELHAHFPGPMSYFPRLEIQRTRAALGGAAPPGAPQLISGALSDPCQVPTGGNQRVLVLPVVTSDFTAPPSSQDNKAKISDFLFGNPAGRRTLTNYYTQASRGAASPLVLSGDVGVVGNAADTLGWRSIAHSLIEENKTNGSEFMSGQDPLVTKALAAFDADIDGSLYDNNDNGAGGTGDGCIDWLIVMHSGPDQAITRDPKDVWSHFEYYPNGQRPTLAGKTVWGVMVVSAWSPIGIYAHEFGHALGLPDLYSYGPPNKSIVGNWSLMDLGTWTGPAGHRGEYPVGLDPFSAVALGWASAQMVSTSQDDVDVLSPTGSSPTVKVVPLPDTGTPPSAHYLMVESRFNAAGRGHSGSCATSPGFFIDDCLDSSGVLVWEVDEGGANVFGALRQAVTLADAYPSEGVRGISAEGLLADAPFLPGLLPDDQPNLGASSRFMSRGLRLDVKKAVPDGFRTSLMIDPTPRAELRAKWIRVTPDPHADGGDMTVSVEINNAGAVTATDVKVKLAPLADYPRAWVPAGPRTVGSGMLAPGESATVTWTMTALAPGHLDLHATVESTNAADVILRDKAYVAGKVSQFNVAQTLAMGTYASAYVRDAWDLELANCVINYFPPGPLPYRTVAEVRAGCSGQNPDPACSACRIFDREHSTSPVAAELDNPSFCWDSGGGLRPCKGEVTKVWIRDFVGDSRKEVLVAYRDLTESNRQSAHCATTPRPPDCNDIQGPSAYSATYARGVEYSGLVMFRWNPSQQQLEKVWDLSATGLFDYAGSPGSPYTGANSTYPGYQPWVCQGQSRISANVIELGNGVPVIFASGFCGSPNSYMLYRHDNVSDRLDLHAYGTYSGFYDPPLPFGAQDILAHGNGFDRTGGSNNNPGLIFNRTFVDPPYTFLQTPQFLGIDLSGPKPAFPAGRYVATHVPATDNMFLAPYQAFFGPGTGLVEFDTSRFVSAAPQAFLDDVNGDGLPDFVLADGNGHNTGRLMVFDWGASNTARLKVIRNQFGNVTTSLTPFDWDGDGRKEIVATTALENGIRVYKHVPGTGEYAEIFQDSFGGYTGSGFNPNIAVADVDGNGTPDVVLGQGGHCTVPTVGKGVYVYGFGMVMDDNVLPGMGIWSVAADDLDGDGKAEIVAGSQNGNLYVLKHSQVTAQPPAGGAL